MIKPCGFCQKLPESIRCVFPDSMEDLVGCSTFGCPASGRWIHLEVWNTRGDAKLIEEVARKYDIPEVNHEEV